MQSCKKKHNEIKSTQKGIRPESSTRKPIELLKEIKKDINIMPGVSDKNINYEKKNSDNFEVSKKELVSVNQSERESVKIVEDSKTNKNDAIYNIEIANLPKNDSMGDNNIEISQSSSPNVNPNLSVSLAPTIDRQENRRKSRMQENLDLYSNLQKSKSPNQVIADEQLGKLDIINNIRKFNLQISKQAKSPKKLITNQIIKEVESSSKGSKKSDSPSNKNSKRVYNPNKKPIKKRESEQYEGDGEHLKYLIPHDVLNETIDEIIEERIYRNFLTQDAHNYTTWHLNMILKPKLEMNFEAEEVDDQIQSEYFSNNMKDNIFSHNHEPAQLPYDSFMRNKLRFMDKETWYSVKNGLDPQKELDSMSLYKLYEKGKQSYSGVKDKSKKANGNYESPEMSQKDLSQGTQKKIKVTFSSKSNSSKKIEINSKKEVLTKAQKLQSKVLKKTTKKMQNEDHQDFKKTLIKSEEELLYKERIEFLQISHQEEAKLKASLYELEADKKTEGDKDIRKKHKEQQMKREENRLIAANSSKFPSSLQSKYMQREGVPFGNRIGSRSEYTYDFKGNRIKIKENDERQLPPIASPTQGKFEVCSVIHHETITEKANKFTLKMANKRLSKHHLSKIKNKIITKKRSYSQYNMPVTDCNELMSSFTLNEGVKILVTNNKYTLEKSAPLRKMIIDENGNNKRQNREAYEFLKAESRALSPIYRSFNNYRDKSERNNYSIANSHLTDSENSSLRVNSALFYDQFIDSRLIKSATVNIKNKLSSHKYAYFKEKLQDNKPLWVSRTDLHNMALLPDEDEIEESESMMYPDGMCSLDGPVDGEYSGKFKHKNFFNIHIKNKLPLSNVASVHQKNALETHNKIVMPKKSVQGFTSKAINLLNSNRELSDKGSTGNFSKKCFEQIENLKNVSRNSPSNKRKIVEKREVMWRPIPPPIRPESKKNDNQTFFQKRVRDKNMSHNTYERKHAHCFYNPSVEKKLIS